LFELDYGLGVETSTITQSGDVETRDLTVFTGERDMSPVNFRELRDRPRGFRLNLADSGNF